MTPVFTDEATHVEHAPPLVQRVDDTRGTYGMLLFILTEGMLFVFLFFSYYYLEKGNERWAVEQPPKLHYALPQLGVVIAAAFLLWWGQKRAVRRKVLSARVALVAAIVLGLGYLALSYFDYSEHLQHVRPDSYSYGSIFYTITTLHAGHLILGILMLFWVLALPASKWEPVDRPPHRSYYNVTLYWCFLALVWAATVGILYIGPTVYNAL